MPEVVDKSTGRRDKAPVPVTGVRDCFQWVENERSKPILPEQDEKPYHHKFILKKADVGKSRDVGYAIPTPPPPKPKDEESAGEALRGWPGQQRQVSDSSRSLNQPKGEEDLTNDKNMTHLMAHSSQRRAPNQAETTTYIDGVPEKQKSRSQKKLSISQEDQQTIEEMAQRPTKIKPPTKVEAKKVKEFDSSIQGRRAWRS